LTIKLVYREQKIGNKVNLGDTSTHFGAVFSLIPFQYCKTQNSTSGLQNVKWMIFIPITDNLISNIVPLRHFLVFLSDSVIAIFW